MHMSSMRTAAPYSEQRSSLRATRTSRSRRAVFSRPIRVVVQSGKHTHTHTWEYNTKHMISEMMSDVITINGIHYNQLYFKYDQRFKVSDLISLYGKERQKKKNQGQIQMSPDTEHFSCNRSEQVVFPLQRKGSGQGSQRSSAQEKTYVALECLILFISHMYCSRHTDQTFLDHCCWCKQIFQGLSVSQCQQNQAD